MTLAFPLLFWIGAPLLLAAALAVHLLNLQRQRPVQWAAMEFLLESERINRVLMNLKQWLLLALRLAALALAAFALAGPMLDKFNVGPLAGSRVLHLVVLDDSYSMADAGSNNSCWSDALAAVDKVLSIESPGDQQQVTILRTSELELSPREPAPITAIGAEEIANLRRTVQSWTPSQTVTPLLDALDQTRQVAEAAPTGVRKVVYVVTDGRLRDAQPLGALSTQVEAIQESGALVRWVDCAASHNDNLSISDLSLLPGPQAAGVELTLSVAVTNNGPTPVESAIVQIERDGRSSPAVEMGRIQPGQTARRRFGVLFPAPGEHRVTAKLDSDAVEADNQRLLAVSLAEQRNVLIVDGSPGRRESIPFAAALKPNDRINTGWRPEVVTPRKIAQQTNFQDYAAVVLLDVASLPEATAAAIRAHTAGGAGLLVVLGQDSDPDFYNQWLLGEAAQPVIPATLTTPHKPPAAKDEKQGDLVVGKHPLFRVFAGERDSFLSLVAINYCFGVTMTPEAMQTHTLAWHNSGEPLLLDSRFDRGRASVLLTSIGQSQRASESWSNLSTLPIFPVLALELIAHSACQHYEPTELNVGERWPRGASAGGEQRVRIGRVSESGAVELVAESLGDELSKLPTPDAAGYFQLERSGAAGVKSSLLGVNVDPEEGDLRLAPREQLADALGSLGVGIENAVALSANTGESPPRIPLVLGAIVLALLVGEQALAVACGYHEPTGGRAA